MKVTFFAAISLLISQGAFATGTINLSLNNVAYCATAQAGNNFSGVSPGVCTVAPPPTPTPTPPPSTCPAGRHASGGVEYYGCGNGCPATLPAVDLTKFENIWGRYSPTEAPLFWPGEHSYVYLTNFPRSQYLAAKFHTPATGSYSGWLSLPEYFAVDMAVSISTGCGDFTTMPTACFTPSVARHGLVLWRFNNGASGCHLLPNTDYYLNVKLADPNVVSPYCNNSNCNIGGVNNLTQ